MSSREFNQHTSRAKAAADEGPLVITDRGEPAYVLMSRADYERLSGRRKRISIAEALADPRPEADFPFEFQRLRALARAVDFDDPA
jgi:prevent-host-death family protein